MLKSILSSSAIGFLFGIVISILAYLGYFQVAGDIVWLIPFLSGILCGIGTLAGTLVDRHLSSKSLINEKNRTMISFAAAALVNTFLVLLIISFYQQTFSQREIIIFGIAGIVMGAAYSIYRYRMDRLNERMKFLEELADKNRQLQDASRQLAITKERNRMGRELHDSISQGLHGLVFAIHSLRNSLKNPPKNVIDILTHMEATANSTLDELRTMIEELKPSLLTEKGLEETIKTTASLFSQRRQIPVKLTIQTPESITPDQEMSIYRIFQEALANIERHSGAKQVSVNLSCNGENIVLNIKDDGRGFDAKIPPPGHGLKNMRQRAEEADGSLQVISKPGLGTSITASFPSKG